MLVTSSEGRSHGRAGGWVPCRWLIRLRGTEDGLTCGAWKRGIYERLRRMLRSAPQNRGGGAPPSSQLVPRARPQTCGRGGKRGNRFSESPFPQGRVFSSSLYSLITTEFKKKSMLRKKIGGNFP